MERSGGGGEAACWERGCVAESRDEFGGPEAGGRGEEEREEREERGGEGTGTGFEGRGFAVRRGVHVEAAREERLERACHRPP